jgi:uncharacterized hydrophobic protein (TIGR00341 family)
LKRINVTVIPERKENIRQIFEDLNLQALYTSGTQNNEIVISFSALIPDELVDDAIEKLTKGMDLRKKENTISVSDVEAFISTSLEKVKERIAKEKPIQNPLERLINATDKHVRPNKNTFTMALFATIVAFSGLFLDNVAIVIGAMLLSPLLGPLNAFAVNANLGRLRKVLISQISIIALIAAIILLSAATTFVVSNFVDIPINSGQILLRTHASVSDIAIALVIGLAGGLALYAALPELLVGVAIAVALVPPATVAGIGLALQNSEIFAGAFALTAVYLIGLELGSSVMLRIRGVSPRRYYQKSEAKTKFAYSIILLIALFVILSAVIYFLNI